MTIRRVGIMTGGGDCPGLNAVIRAAVKVGVQQYGWDILGIEDAFHGLVDLDYRSPRGNIPLGLQDVRDILPRGGTVLGTSNRANPFKFPVREDGRWVERDVSQTVFENFTKLKLDALISIGGDGSMGIAAQLSELGLPVVGVPKTIDNDLDATDVTFGFDTAVQIATEALDRVRDTAESHDRVMFVEMMGRDAGFIALHAGLAGGAHAILVPEIPYRLRALQRLIDERHAQGMPYSVIVVAEGARPADGESSTTSGEVGGMRRHMGAAARIAEALGDQVDDEIRVTVLGHLQRGGSPSAFDRILATRFGHHAAKLVAEEKFGTMVALRTPHIVAVPLAAAVNHPKRVDPAGQLVASARALGVRFGDEL